MTKNQKQIKLIIPGTITKALEQDVGDEVYDVIITSTNVDSVGDVVSFAGLDTKRFLKNPVVHYNHDTGSYPVAKCIGLSQVGDYIVAKTVFNTITEDGRNVKDMVDSGFLNCASIGFYSLKNHKEPFSDEEKALNPKFELMGNKLIHDVWELIEYSIVNIPANTDAMIQERKSLLDEDIEEATTPDTTETPIETPIADEPIEPTIEAPTIYNNDITEKAGATLNKSNRELLTQAIDILTSILSTTDFNTAKSLELPLDNETEELNNETTTTKSNNKERITIKDYLKNKED